MRQAVRITLAVLIVFASASSVSASYAIDPTQLDRQKVLWGSAQQFERPAEVDYEDIVKATPEYEEIRRRRIERGTGRYWILLTQASDRAMAGIAKAGRELKYDLVTRRGYLSTLDPAIPAEDITKGVLEVLKEEAKSSSR